MAVFTSIQRVAPALVRRCILLDLLYRLRLSWPIVDDVHNMHILCGAPRYFWTQTSRPVDSQVGGVMCICHGGLWL